MDVRKVVEYLVVFDDVVPDNIVPDMERLAAVQVTRHVNELDARILTLQMSHRRKIRFDI